MTKIHRDPDPDSLARRAAEFISKRAEAALKQSGRFSLVLAGGSTPTATYCELGGLLMRNGLDLQGIEVYWGDERCVPPDHPQSNYRMAKETLLDDLGLGSSQVFRMSCEKAPEAGAKRYEEMLRERFPSAAAPRFDLILLGLGADAHTASLFPGSKLLQERERWVAAEKVASLNSWRMTLTPLAINGARQVLFLVQGESKTDAVYEVIVGAHGPRQFPAQSIEPEDGELHWFLDEAAAGRI